MYIDDLPWWFYYSDEYGRMFGDVTERQGWRVFPNDLLARWESVLDDIRQGYQDNIYELDYDLHHSRGYIEMTLEDEVLNTFEEHAVFKAFIQKLDTEYRNLTQECPSLHDVTSSWWERRILRSAGKYYVETLPPSVKNAGLIIKVID